MASATVISWLTIRRSRWIAECGCTERRDAGWHDLVPTHSRPWQLLANNVLQPTFRKGNKAMETCG